LQLTLGYDDVERRPACEIVQFLLSGVNILCISSANNATADSQQSWLRSLLPEMMSTWPHLRCYVGFEEGEYWKKTLCIVYYYNGTQRTTSSYRLVDCIGLWSCLV